MDAKHWHNRWENNEIGFHEGDVNRYLDQYFTNLSLQPGDTVFVPLCGTPEITNHGTLTCYQGANLTVWVGDIFTLTPEQLGTVNAVYDRAALVALPLSMRVRYTQHILQLANKAQQLVVVFEYQQSEFSGPPFNVTANELHQHYDAYYQLALLCREPLEGGLKGKIPAMNAAWLLS